MNSVEVSQHPFVPFSSNSGLYLVSMTICWKHLQILQPTSLVARLISPSGELVPLSGTTSNHSLPLLILQGLPPLAVTSLWLRGQMPGFYATVLTGVCSDQAGVYYVMGSLRGRALVWAEVICSNQSPSSAKLFWFTSCCGLLHGVLGSVVGWNEEVLRRVFIQGKTTWL